MATINNINDPFAAQKAQKTQTDEKLASAEKENKANAAAAQKEMIKKISKALAPVMGYLLGKGIIALVVNNKKLERLAKKMKLLIFLSLFIIKYMKNTFQQVYCFSFL
jgi:uncharacterized protein YbcI